MIKTFLIGGEIVKKETDKESFEDVTPSQVDMFLKNCADDDTVIFEFASYGGDLFAGLQIYHTIKNAKQKTVAKITSIAASIASIIACACDEIQICDNAFYMVHLPMTTIFDCNQIELENEIKTLEQATQALIGIYKTVFVTKTDDEIYELLKNETWILGTSAKEYGLNFEVLPCEKEFRFAANIKSRFNNVPMSMEEIKNKTVETVENEKTETVDCDIKNDTENHAVEEITTTEETKTEPEPIVDDEIEKKIQTRVSGMQSKMQIKINDLVKDYECKIKDFKNEIEGMNKKLMENETTITNLRNDLEKSSKELQSTVSTLKEKETALNSLTHNALNKPINNVVDWRKLKGQEFFDWYKANKDYLTNN